MGVAVLCYCPHSAGRRFEVDVLLHCCALLVLIQLGISLRRTHSAAGCSANNAVRMSACALLLIFFIFLMPCYALHHQHLMSACALLLINLFDAMLYPTSSAHLIVYSKILLSNTLVFFCF